MTGTSDPRPSWDETWLGMGQVLTARSKCVRSQVAALIVDSSNHLVSTGYNGPPAALPNSDGPCSEWCARARDGVGVGTQEFAACESLHGEMNALLKGSSAPFIGGTMYVSRLPCISCSRAIAAAGLARVVWLDDGTEKPDRLAQVTRYLENVGVEVTPVEKQGGTNE